MQVQLLELKRRPTVALLVPVGKPIPDLKLEHVGETSAADWTVVAQGLIAANQPFYGLGGAKTAAAVGDLQAKGWHAYATTVAVQEEGSARKMVRF